MLQLDLETVTSVETGLRHGILVDMLRRLRPSGRRRHHRRGGPRPRAALRLRRGPRRTRWPAWRLRLFDDLASLHRLPASSRPDPGGGGAAPRRRERRLLLAPPQAHLLPGANGDIPGFSDHERQLVALVARFHRRSPPEREPPGAPRPHGGRLPAGPQARDPAPARRLLRPQPPPAVRDLRAATRWGAPCARASARAAPGRPRGLGRPAGGGALPAGLRKEARASRARGASGPRGPLADAWRAGGRRAR